MLNTQIPGRASDAGPEQMQERDERGAPDYEADDETEGE